jgi:hypothetical protein
MKIETFITGIRFHPGAHDKLAASPEGTPIDLVRQPDNPYDGNAIACEIDGVLVGFVPRERAMTLARDIDSGERVTATLHRYNGLTIEVAEPEDKAA